MSICQKAAPRAVNHLFSAKNTKTEIKMSFFISDYFSKSSLLISTFTWPVDYKKQKNCCKGSLFTQRCINKWVKHWLFLGKYRFKVVKLKDCKIKYRGSKTFQERSYRNSKIFNIANLVNTRITEIIKYQLHGGSNHLLSVKRIKIKKEKVLLMSNCFNRSSLLISIFKCDRDQNNCEKYCQGRFFIYKFNKNGGK